MNGVALRSIITGGLVATALVTAMAAMANALGLLRLSFGRLLGTLLAPDTGLTRAVGWGLHLINGATFAIGYRKVFQRTGFSPGLASGAAVGLGHFLLSMAGLALMPRLHPRPGQAGLRPLGPFAYGPMTVPGMLAGHAIYGGVVGWFLRSAAGSPGLPVLRVGVFGRFHAPRVMALRAQRLPSA